MNEANGQPEPDYGPIHEYPPGFYEYRGTIPLMELPCDGAYATDDAWWLSMHPNLCEEYEGLCVALFQRAVWGAGKNEDAAWAEVQKRPGCPARDQLTFIPIAKVMAGQSRRGQQR